MSYTSPESKLYFGAAVKRLWEYASDVKEDWGQRTVSFRTSNRLKGPALNLDTETREKIAEIFGTLDIQVVAHGRAGYDERDAPSGEIEVTLMNVNFPARP